MNQTYKTGTGKDLPLEKYVTGEGRKWLQKNGINVSGETGSAGASYKVGDTVQIGDKRIKISAIHADGTFDGDEVK